MRLGITARAMGVALVAISLSIGSTEAKTRVVVGTTLEFSVDPYLVANALSYTISCQTYGCLGRYDARNGKYVGMLAESWESVDPTTWIFHLRKDIKWENGEPVTSADAVHSFWRMMNDPQGYQKGAGEGVKSFEAVDDYTVKVTTNEPLATLITTLVNQLVITNKKIYDQYGAEAADRQHRMGFGPYRIVDQKIGQLAALEKVPTSVFATPDSPDELIFRIMKEPEQRITALLKGEIQIAQYIPPHMIERVNKAPNTHVAMTNGLEINFIGMNPKFKPWNNKKMRQAVAYAIDKDTIRDVILGGLADRLDGPIGEGQYAYDPQQKPIYPYDPEKAKQLVKESGYDGASVDFLSSGRFINEKETSQAIIGMLQAVGINAQLKMPEWAALSSDIIHGKAGFYFYGHGSVIDPAYPLSKYFEAGPAERLAYSNPEVNELFARSRTTFDPEERKAMLQKMMAEITEDAPADFLWRMKVIYGIANNVDYTPAANGMVFGDEMKVKP